MAAVQDRVATPFINLAVLVMHLRRRGKKRLQLPVSELEQQIRVDMKRLKAADANLKARHSHLHRETSAQTDV